MRLHLAFLIYLLFFVSSVRADEPPNLLRNSDFSGGLQDWFLKGADRCQVNNTIISNASLKLPFTGALFMEVAPQAQDKPWSVVLRQTIAAPLEKDKQLVFRVWARSSAKATITPFVEAAKPPYAKALSGEWKLTAEWVEYEIAGPCPQNFGAGEINAGFFLSHGKADVRLAHARFFCLDKGATLPPLASTKPAAPIKPPVDPGELLKNGDFSEGFNEWTVAQDEHTEVEVVKGQVGGYDRIARAKVVIVPPPGPPRAMPDRYRLEQTTAQQVRTGDGLVYTAWLRSPENCQVSFVVVDNVSRVRRRQLFTTLNLESNWKQYEFRGISKADFAPGELLCQLWLGQRRGTIEMAGMSLTRVPDVSPEWPGPATAQPFSRANILNNGDFHSNRRHYGQSEVYVSYGRWLIPNNENCQSEIVGAQAGPFNMALRVVRSAASKGSASLTQTNSFPALLPTETTRLRFWARSPDAVTTIASLQLQNLPPGEYVPGLAPTTLQKATQTIRLTPEWKEYELVPQGAAGDGKLINTFNIVLAFTTPGTVEVTGFQMPVLDLNNLQGKP